MNEQLDKPKQKRVRRRRLDLQLEQALRDAEAAATSDISTQKLIQTRLTILSTALARERNGKLEKALAEVQRLTAEIERLKQELATKPAVQANDIDLFLAKHGTSCDAPTPTLDEKLKRLDEEYKEANQ